MKQQSIEYYHDKQKLIGEYIYDETLKDKQPTIIVFPAFEGRGDFAVNYAKNLVNTGFNTFVADMYGDGKVADTIEGCFELITPFLQDRQLVRTRANLAFDEAIKHEKTSTNHVGAIGFCFGGMCALEVARSGKPLAAVVSAHGVLAKSELPTEKIQSKVLVLHGYKDPQVPPENLNLFAKEMDEHAVNDWTFTFFGNGKHSFTDLKTDTFDAEKEKEMGREYNQIAAERSFRYAVDFFNEIMK